MGILSAVLCPVKSDLGSRKTSFEGDEFLYDVPYKLQDKKIKIKYLELKAGQLPGNTL